MNVESEYQARLEQGSTWTDVNSTWLNITCITTVGGGNDAEYFMVRPGGTSAVFQTHCCLP